MLTEVRGVLARNQCRLGASDFCPCFPRPLLLAPVSSTIFPRMSWIETLSEQWPVLVATVVGPLAAVLITHMNQKSEREYMRKVAVLSDLVRNRKQMLSPEFFGPLNLVPIVFHGNSRVAAAYSTFLATTQDAGWNFPDTTPQYNEIQQNLAARLDGDATQLLGAMATDLKIDVDQLTLLTKAYLPRGVVQQQKIMDDLKWASARIVMGFAPLKVEVINPAPPPSPPPPLPDDIREKGT
jgi:hypothetical protein